MNLKILPGCLIIGASMTTAVILTSCNNNVDKTSKVQPLAITNPQPTERVKPAPGKGNIQGQVMYNSKPVANIEVKLCEKFSRYIGSSCNGKTYKATTDREGYYVITNVEPGKYETLLVRVFNTKSYIFSTRGIGGLDNVEYDVTANKTLFIDPTHLFKSDLKLVNPVAGNRVSGKDLELKWTAYPEASYYKLNLYPKEVSVQGIYNKRLETTSFKIDTPLPKGEYRWTVEAYNRDDNQLSESSDDITFTVN